MSSLDWFITKRILSRIALVVLVFFGLICLSESMDSWRFKVISESQGQGMAILAIITNAAKWSIKSLSVTVLIGAIIALLDLQSHRELIIIKAGGISIWRIIRMPVFAIALIGISISIFFDAKIVEINRSIMPSSQTTTQSVGGKNNVWLKQNTSEYSYILKGLKRSANVYELKQVTFFLPQKSEYSQIIAKTATLVNGEWQLKSVTLKKAGEPNKTLKTYIIKSQSTRQEIELRLASSEDFTFFELSKALASGLKDPVAQAAAATRFAKLMALPALLVGVLLIAFAFTSQYRRTNSYGSAILSGVILGFVVFVITEMADRAGSSGIIDPLFAAWGSPIVAIVIGVTVLLYKEDGQT
jgi:lipopolysaccharide export system permease protein